MLGHGVLEGTFRGSWGLAKDVLRSWGLQKDVQGVTRSFEGYIGLYIGVRESFAYY